MTRTNSQFAIHCRNLPASLATAPWRSRCLRMVAWLLGAAWAFAGIDPAQAAQVALTWQDNSDNETGFRIERAAAGGSYVMLTTTAANSTSHADTTVIAGTTYNYRVCAFNNAGDSIFSNIATVAVTATNTAPTISNIFDRTILEDASTGTVSFTIGDAETAAGGLTVSASSSNTILVPASAITLGGSGANRTITVAPAANRNGSATITVTVSDGQLSTADSFTLTVSPVNDAPTITDLGNRSIAQDSTTGAITVTIGDVETAAGSLTLSAVSSNTTLVPAAAIALGGSGASRTITITPAAGRSGTATITLTVSDGAASTSDSFVLTVSSVAPANTAPTISNIFNRTILEDASTGSISFTVADFESSATSLTVSAVSSNASLVPANGIAFGGSGANRTITITPAANRSGSATITVTVSDGTLTAADAFTLNVTAVNDAPTLSAIADQTINANASTSALAFTIGDEETPAADLQVSATSSNATLVPMNHVGFGGTGANRTVTITPVAGQSGTATITLTVSDGSAGATEQFTVTIAPLQSGNVEPTISPLPDQLVAQDGVIGPVAFNVGDGETPASDLLISVASSNPLLVPPANILVSGAGATRSLSILPAAGQSGAATITITVSDGTTTSSAAFTITVLPAVHSRLMNLSTRVVCRPGEESLIPGFVITGTANKRVLLRAVGPTLARDPFRISGVLPDPRMRLLRREGQQFVEHATNDDWHAAANAGEVRAVSAELYAFPLTENGHDAALLLDLPPGSYTVIVDDPQMTRGIVIVELYDADEQPDAATFVNMSTRGYVGVGDEVMIAGFVISDESPKTVLIRAIGPAMAGAPFNVPNVLADPLLELYRHNGDGTDTLLLTHDNWSEEPNAGEVAAVSQSVYAFALATGSKDAAIVTTLDPGIYTVVVRGANGASGSALVEAYAVNLD